MNSTMLEVRNLKKYFPSKRGVVKAVNDISFTIERGETLGIVGESGCGKSTTGRAVLRLIEPTAGKVFLNGQDIAALDRQELQEARKHMQIIFQDPFASLNPRMSISEIIGEPFEIYRLYAPAERKEKVAELMELVGLSPRLVNAYPHELDGGRRQRVGVARALALRPQFIVCDEPVSALDVSIRAQILNLIQDLQEKLSLTYMFISHDLSVVKHISDRVAVMYLGKIVEITRSKRIFTSPAHPYTRALLSAIPLPKVGVKRERILLEGDVPSPINPPSGCIFSGRCRHVMERCRREEPDLCDIEDGHYVACFLAHDRARAGEA